MKVFVPIAGTHGIDTDDRSRLWWFGDHPWQSFMRANDCRALDPEDPFYWSTDLSWRGWKAGGLALIWYLTAKMDRFNDQPLRLITHSFGLNPVAWAAFEGLEIDTLISIGPPYRATWKEQYAALRERTKRWMTIHATERDRMVIGGGLFDGEFNAYPPLFQSDYRDTMPGIGHSKILYQPEWFHLWQTNGWIELLISESWGSRNPEQRASASILPLPISSRRSAARFNARSIKSD